MALTIGLGALTYFKFLRGSRSLWLHLMVKHDPKIEERVRSENGVHIDEKKLKEL